MKYLLYIVAIVLLATTVAASITVEAGIGFNPSSTNATYITGKEINVNNITLTTTELTLDNDTGVLTYDETPSTETNYTIYDSIVNLGAKNIFNQSIQTWTLHTDSYEELKDATEQSTSSSSNVLEYNYTTQTNKEFINSITYLQKATSGESSTATVIYYYTDGTTGNSGSTTSSTSYVNRTATNPNFEKKVSRIEVYQRTTAGGTSYLDNLYWNISTYQETQNYNITAYMNSEATNTFLFTNNNSDYYQSYQTFSPTAWTETTDHFTGLFNSIVNITAENAVNSSTINTFSITAEHYTPAYTITNSTTDSSLLFNWIQDNQVSLFVNVGEVTDSFNFTPNASTFSYTASILEELTLRTYNASDSTITSVSVTAYLENATNQYTYTSTDGYYFFPQARAGNAYTIKFVSSEFLTTYDIITTSDYSNIQDYYLVEEGTNITFTVTDQNGVVQENAQIKVETFIGGIMTEIGKKTTDVTGTAIFSLQTAQTHRITVSKSGYVTQTFITTLEDGTEYTIALQPSVSYDFDLGYGRISYDHSPKAASLAPNTTTFYFNITAFESDLNSFSLALYNGSYSVSKLIASNSSTNASGGSLSLTVDLGPYNSSTVILRLFYNQENYGDKEVFFNYKVTRQFYTGTLDELKDRLQDELSLTMRLTLFTVVFIISMIIFATVIRGIANLFLSLIMAIFFAWLFGLSLFIVGTIVFIAIVAILALSEVGR